MVIYVNVTFTKMIVTIESEQTLKYPDVFRNVQKLKVLIMVIYVNVILT